MTVAYYECKVVLQKLAEMKPITYQLLLSKALSTFCQKVESACDVMEGCRASFP